MPSTMSDLDEALRLARETIAATAPESCDCNECKLARALLALAEQRTAEQERADVVAFCSRHSRDSIAFSGSERAMCDSLSKAIGYGQHIGSSKR